MFCLVADVDADDREVYHSLEVYWAVWRLFIWIGTPLQKPFCNLFIQLRMIVYAMIILLFGHLGYGFVISWLQLNYGFISSVVVSGFWHVKYTCHWFELFCYWFTIQVSGHGIDSLAKFFLDFGYSQRDELRFPAKKLKAHWFSPPSLPIPEGGSGVHGPLPRVFISELLVDQMSSQAQVC